jgi:ferric-dicitrate binding protein FerR (iron transport regulator)
MPSTAKAKSALPYLTQLLEDDFIQSELRHAAQGLRAVYERTREEPAKATEDKRVYANLRRAATSIRNAATALQRPKPQPKKRPIGKIATLAFAAGGCVLLTLKLQKQYANANRPDTSAPGATMAGPPASTATDAPTHPTAAPGQPAVGP